MEKLKHSKNKIPSRWLLCAFYALLLFSPSFGQSDSSSGTVRDQSGAAIVNAKISVLSPNSAVLQETFTDGEGHFSLKIIPDISGSLMIAADGFETRRVAFRALPKTLPLQITLAPASFRAEITVTANRGLTTKVEAAASVINAHSRNELISQPLPTIGNALEGDAGVHFQQSTYGQVSPFLRGLTGYQVLNLIDGVRFNNSTFRSGPNQFLAFVEPGQIERLEAMLGPGSSQYGSDALGGTIQLQTVSPEFAESGKQNLSGELNTFAATADKSFGADGRFSFGDRSVALLVGGSFRRHNDVRAGGGKDSRHVFKRFFGLSDDLIRQIYGSRLQDTGFSQSGGFGKLLARLGETQNLTVSYQQTAQKDVRGYKDLWGGLGRLRSDFEPQNLRFFYARYEKFGLGFLDSLSGTFSVNSQTDGSVRQGLRASDKIIRDENSVKAFGYAVQATMPFTKRQTIVFGGEIYDERINASRFEIDPNINLSARKRALYPNGSRYATGGLFAQNTLELFCDKLRVNFGGRYTRVGFRTFADRNRDAAGNNLGVIDSSLVFNDFSYNGAISWQTNSFLSFNFLTGRGFRAPNLNDLGALGLNDLGFELPAASIVSGFVGTSDGEGVASSGKPVSPLQAEKLFNYELGATIRTRPLYVRVQFFNAELKDPIVRRTLLFPVEQIPATLAGVAVLVLPQTPVQRAQNVASVAAALDPRAVKAFVNDGAARYYGFETIFRYDFSPRWSFDGNYSFLAGRELNPNRHVRRLSPAQGSAALRFQPGGNRLRLDWLELNIIFSQSQNRLSGGDTTDERIGAARRRRDIADFFQGSLVRPFINPGSDRIFGTADDLFTPTNEMIAQIRNRVLPVGANVNGVTVFDDNTRVPLYTKTGGYATINLRGSFALAEKVNLNVGLFNILDRNYRTHGSGTDSPGINFWTGLRFSF
ncbi:MAG: TonB-dependent receptor [Acidobacteriota bacterium]|nr:TonB-dependent receptor [Acidobacteriota bacterium]